MQNNHGLQTTPHEIKRVKDFQADEVACLRCGKLLPMFFNGGEGDKRTCCGLVYRTECARIDLVVTEDANAH